MKKSYYTLLQILDLKNTEKVVNLLKEHSDDVASTDCFQNTSVCEPNTNEGMDPSFVMVSMTPTSDEKWKEYEASHRAEKRTWFKTNLLDSGLVKVCSSWMVSMPD